MQARTVDVGHQDLPDGSTIGLPPVLLARWGNDPSKPTLLVYGHLDVQPAALEDGWDTDPWKLTEIDGKMFGRGSTDDKGPVLGWLAAVQAYQLAGIPLPVNLRCIFEGMEESGSLGLSDCVRRLAIPGGYLDPETIDFICISDNYYLGKTKPCLTYGLRGNCYFHLTVECAKKDLHSGVAGGSVHEAMTDLVKVLGTLVSVSGKICVDGIDAMVDAVTEAEMERYKVRLC